MISDDPSVIEPTLKSLKANFQSHETKDLSFRVAQLRQLQKGIIELRSEFQQAFKTDLGYDSPDFANFLQIDSTIGMIDYDVKNLSKWAAKRYVDTNLAVAPGVSYIIPEPLGVVLVIGAWNYPLFTGVAPAAQSIAAGNSVILKPSELTPNVSNVIKKLFDKYMDPRYYQVIEGGYQVSSNIIKQRFDQIIFTGGTEKGRIVAKAAAENLVPVILELGGKSPCIVDGTVDMAMTCRRIAQVKYFNHGQTCIAPDYILVQENVKEQFINTLVSTIKHFYGENSKKSPFITKIVTEGHTERLLGLLKDSGGKVVIGGNGDIKERWIEPTIIEDPNPHSKLMSEEIFGPIIPVLSYKQADEAISFINERPKPLALYYFGNVLNDRIDKETSSGGVCFNECAFHVFNPNLPFGGVGFSGQGALHGQVGFDQCSHLKPVLAKSPQDALMARYPPGSATSQKILGMANKYGHVMLGDVKRAGLLATSIVAVGLAVKFTYFPKRKAQSQ